MELEISVIISLIEAALSTISASDWPASSAWLTARAICSAAAWVPPLHLPDDGVDPRGRGGGALGQLAHLIGYHIEARPGHAGAGGFDGRVERQDVGLGGDIGDQVDHLADILGALPQFLQGRIGLGQATERGLHGVVALLGAHHRRLSGTAGGLGVAGHLLHGRRHLLHSRRDTHHLLGLAIGPRTTSG